MMSALRKPMVVVPKAPTEPPDVVTVDDVRVMLPLSLRRHVSNEWIRKNVAPARAFRLGKRKCWHRGDVVRWLHDRAGTWHGDRDE